MEAIERRVRDIVATMPGAEVIDCDPALADTADFCAAYGYSLDDSANAIVVIGKASSAVVAPVYAACVVLATTRLDVNRAVRQRLGTKKASFAPAEVTAALTGMTMGGVTPFALPADLALWIDARVMQRDRIIVGGGSRAAKVVGPPSMLLTIAQAEVVTDLAILLPTE
ncbi:MAG TPA: YbaK/EbsC family protein [Ilumatobacteraceae bacterium]|nr:YbaK/EbsC family protein [Ilumatobacteraceae bacterium]